MLAKMTKLNKINEYYDQIEKKKVGPNCKNQTKTRTKSLFKPLKYKESSIKMLEKIKHNITSLS